MWGVLTSYFYENSTEDFITYLLVPTCHNIINMLLSQSLRL